MTLRALIVDDEAIARRRVRRLLRDVEDVEVAGECADGPAALGAIQRLRPDLVFLDVQMPGLDGFGVVERLGAAPAPALIFVTAFDRYALQAFDAHAIDYLLKPIDPARLRAAVARARQWVAGGGEPGDLRALLAQLRERPRYLSRLAVRSGRRIALVDVAAIEWLQAADNYVSVRAGGREYLLRETLTSLEQQLDPARFLRIHRSTIVALDRVLELEPATHGDFHVRLRDGTRLTLSRSWRERLERALGRPL